MDTSFRVLIVDDDDGICDFVGMLLAEEGCLTAAAPNGQAALELLPTFKPHLILLDVMMPTLNGLRFLEAYTQTMEPIAHIVVMSASVNLINEAKQYGQFDELPKPFHLRDLLGCVERHRFQH